MLTSLKVVASASRCLFALAEDVDAAQADSLGYGGMIDPDF